MTRRRVLFNCVVLTRVRVADHNLGALRRRCCTHIKGSQVNSLRYADTNKKRASTRRSPSDLWEDAARGTASPSHHHKRLSGPVRRNLQVVKPLMQGLTAPLNCRVFINLRSYYNYKFPYYNYKFPFIIINFKIYYYKFPYERTLQHKQEIDLNCHEYKMTDFVPDRGELCDLLPFKSFYGPSY